MYIKSIRIKNLRVFEDETVLLDRYTSLVGANGAGKSTVLCALNIFFRENESAPTNLSNLDREDFHQENVEEPVEITVTFGDLGDEAKKDFSDYVRQDVLVVTAKAIFDPNSGYATVKQFGNRLGMEKFSEFFRAADAGSKVAQLKEIFADLKSEFSDLPSASTKDAMLNALREYEAARPEHCVLLPSEDQFYGATQGQGLLRKYVQWVYVPAVKDAAGEQLESKNTALGRLLSRTVRAKVDFSDNLAKLREEAENKYRDMIDAEQGVLDDISSVLQGRLVEWSHPEATARLQWNQDSKSAIRIEEPLARLIAGDGEFEGQISRFGHGMQRSYIIALLQGLSDIDVSSGPTLILGCEEPELYQHPPQAKHLASVLHSLSTNNSQILVSTHSPYFVDGESFGCVRLVRKDREKGFATVRDCDIGHLAEQYSKVTGDKLLPQEGALAKLHQVMQPHLSEMFFTPFLVLVEGLEDAAFIHAWMVITKRWEAFRKSGCHIVAANGKSEIIRPLIIAQKMEIPIFVLFDCDSDKLEHANADTAKSRRALHEKDNKALFSLLGVPDQPAFPTSTVWGSDFAAWPTDLGSVIKGEVPGTTWQAANAVAMKEHGHVGGPKKNTLYIGSVLNALFEAGEKPPTLEKLCSTILGEELS